MPTHEETDVFWRDWDRLSTEQQEQFLLAVHQFVEDIKAQRAIRASLGIKRYKRRPGVWEFAWAPDGRALFTYGTSPQHGEIHIIWLRVGTHDIYKQ